MFMIWFNTCVGFHELMQCHFDEGILQDNDWYQQFLNHGSHGSHATLLLAAEVGFPC